MSASQKRLVLIACVMGTTVVTVDSTVVNVALPAIRDDLGGGFAGQQWTANAYLVTLASLILVGGSLGDIFGERRVFSLGVAGFGVASILCAAAPTIELLVVARALQGVAGAMLTPAALAVIVTVFPEDERAKAVGAWTAWGAIGVVVGPIVGGQIVDSASWRWIFALNVPLVIATMVLVAKAVPESRGADKDTKVDVLGAALCAFGLAAITFGLIRQPEVGTFADPTVAVPLIGGLLSFAAFLLYEARASHPMLPLELFRRRNFAAGNIETLSMYAGLSLLFFFLVLFLQNVAGYSAVAAGSATLPVTIVMFLTSMRFGALADRYGPRFFMGFGPIVAGLGMALLTQLEADLDYVTDLLPGLLIFSLGLSMTVAPLTATVLSDADEHNAGIASGVNNAIARVAGLLGISIVGAIVAARYGDGSDASVGAFHMAMAISAGLVFFGGVLGLIGIRNPRREVKCAECPGGQLVGSSAEAARATREPGSGGGSARQPDRVRLVRRRQVVRRALRPLARAGAGEYRGAAQRQHALAERAVEQPDHDQQRGPDPGGEDHRAVAERQVEALAVGPLLEQREHRRPGEHDRQLHERERAERAHDQQNGAHGRHALLEVQAAPGLSHRRGRGGRRIRRPARARTRCRPRPPPSRGRPPRRPVGRESRPGRGPGRAARSPSRGARSERCASA